MALASAVRAHIRDYGLAVTLGLIFHRALSRLHHSFGLHWYLFYRQPIQVNPLLRKGGKLAFSWLDSFDPVLEQLPRPVENIQARFDQKAKCMISMKEEELAACAWFAFDIYEEDEVRCTYVIPRHSVWDFDIYVAPKYRMGRTFARSWQAANEALSDQGYQYSLSRISAYNMASRSAHERLGATRVGAALFLKLGLMQLMYSTLRPRISFRLIRTRPPELDFSSA